MSVLAWSHFGLAADSWELTVQVPLSLEGKIFMMCKTIVHSLLHWFLKELQNWLFVYFCMGVSRSCDSML